MDEKSDQNRPATRKDKWWAVVRIFLGMGQMIGASAAVMLLLQTGMSMPAIAVTGATTMLTIISILLFRIQWKRAPNDDKKGSENEYFNNN